MSLEPRSSAEIGTWSYTQQAIEPHGTLMELELSGTTYLMSTSIPVYSGSYDFFF